MLLLQMVQVHMIKEGPPQQEQDQLNVHLIQIPLQNHHEIFFHHPVQKNQKNVFAMKNLHQNLQNIKRETMIHPNVHFLPQA